MPIATESKPCDRFSKMKLTKEFVAHLPNCKQCRVVLAKLESELDSAAAFLRDAKTH
jgi:hypothetical protein